MVIFKTLKNRTNLKSSLSDTIGLKKDSVEKCCWLFLFDFLIGGFKNVLHARSTGALNGKKGCGKITVMAQFSHQFVTFLGLCAADINEHPLVIRRKNVFVKALNKLSHKQRTHHVRDNFHTGS